MIAGGDRVSLFKETDVETESEFEKSRIIL